jgi:hypothetical protein
LLAYGRVEATALQTLETVGCLVSQLPSATHVVLHGSGNPSRNKELPHIISSLKTQGKWGVSLIATDQSAVDSSDSLHLFLPANIKGE